MAPRFSPSFTRPLSSVPTIVDIMISIYAQKSTATDRYWWSFGPAKFDAAMAEFEAKIRRAVASSILVCFLHIMHINVDDDIIYYLVSQGDDIVTKSYHYFTQHDRVCTEMTNFASFHNNTRRFLSSSPRHFSIAQTIVNITFFIWAQKSTTTDEYWWSFGPAKFDAAMAEFEAKTRRAEAPSILVCFLHIMHINVAIVSSTIV